MCDKSVKPAFLDRNDGIRQKPPSQLQKQRNSLFYIRVLSENQKQAPRTPYLERTAEATGVSRNTVALIRREKSKTGRLSSPTRAKREPYKYVDSFDKEAIQHKITKFYTVWKQLPTLNSLISTLVGDLAFTASVGTLRKRLSHLGYCWKKKGL